jgi:hypothetical protein
MHSRNEGGTVVHRVRVLKLHQEVLMTEDKRMKNKLRTKPCQCCTVDLVSMLNVIPKKLMGTYDGGTHAHARIRQLIRHVDLNDVAFVGRDQSSGVYAIDSGQRSSETIRSEIGVDDVKLNNVSNRRSNSESS